MFAPGAKTTWNNCIVPVENAASEPARYNRHARTNVSSNISCTSIGGAFEPATPMLERLRVVQPEILDVEHGELVWFENVLEDLAQRWRIGARKDALADPWIQ